MFQENLKYLRKAKGLSQEELAQRLHVVRQTISKWEKGLSVPDADLLIQLADTLDVTVSELLGSTIESKENTNDTDAIAQKLEQLNLLLAEKNNRSRRIWKVIAGVFFGSIAIFIIIIILSILLGSTYKSDTHTEVYEVEMDEEFEDYED